MRLRRLLSVAFGVGLVFAGLPAVATAAPPDPSAISVSATQLAPGDLLTVTFELFNADTSTITSSNAQLRIAEPTTNIRDVLDVVSCDGTTIGCQTTASSYRGPVGDLPSGATRTVVFHFQVKATAPAGSYTLEHQYVGSNFSFSPRTGPVITIAPQAADIAVSLDASPRGILTNRITYTVGITNLGPGNASAVRVSGSFPAGFSWGGGNGCVRTSGRNVQCDFSNVPVGGSASASFSINAGLLTLGTFTTTMTRTSSTPSDPVSGNDSASQSCAALTGLLVRC
jgi:hypothetical protein